MNSTEMFLPETGTEYHEDISYLLFYTLLGPLFAVGLVGNSLFIIIIAFHTKMRTVTNKYICNLSGANLLTILAAALGPVLDNEVVVGSVRPWVCDVTQLLHETGTCAALFTLVALSAERFLAVRYPLQKKTVTGCVLPLVWIGSFAVSFGELHVTGDPLRCTRTGTRFNLNVVLGKSSFFGFLVSYAIPLAVIAIFFVLMVREIFLSVRGPVESISFNNISDRLHDVNKKIVWVVVVLVITYAVCLLPFYAISLTISASPEKRSRLAIALNVFLMLTDIFPCVNPIILYSMSEPCRKHIRQYLFRCCPGSLAYLPGDEDLINRPIVGRSASVITTTV